MAPVPLPGGFRLRLDPQVRRPRPQVLIGGAPLRVLKLTRAGAGLVDGWAAGRPVGPGRGAGLLAARLVESGIADPQPPEAPALTLAIVIPVRDDPSGLESTLDALSTTAAGVPVTVVDDGSQPPVGPAATGATVVRGPGGGPASARTTGLASLRPPPDVVVFVDAGCRPQPGWLEHLLPHFADPGLAAIAPRVTSWSRPGTPVGVSRYDAARSPIDMGPRGGPVRPGGAVPYVPTAVLAVRTTAMAEVGGFDTGLRFGEDVDLVWRLYAAGWRVRYEPDAQATHPARAGHRPWLRQRFDYGRSAAPLAARHGRAVSPLWVSPWTAAAWGLAVAGRPGAALALTGLSSELLARRAGGDRLVAEELRRLALGGTVRAAGPLSAAIRRAWLPPAALATAVCWKVGGRRARAGLAAAWLVGLIGPGWADWWTRRPGGGPLRWSAWCLADDLAYQAGVWAGVWQTRSAAALIPKW